MASRNLPTSRNFVDDDPASTSLASVWIPGLLAPPGSATEPALSESLLALLSTEVVGKDGGGGCAGTAGGGTNELVAAIGARVILLGGGSSIFICWGLTNFVTGCVGDFS